MKGSIKSFYCLEREGREGMRICARGNGAGCRGRRGLLGLGLFFFALFLAGFE